MMAVRLKMEGHKAHEISQLLAERFKCIPPNQSTVARWLLREPISKLGDIAPLPKIPDPPPEDREQDHQVLFTEPELRLMNLAEAPKVLLQLINRYLKQLQWFEDKGVGSASDEMSAIFRSQWLKSVVPLQRGLAEIMDSSAVDDPGTLEDQRRYRELREIGQLMLSDPDEDEKNGI